MHTDIYGGKLRCIGLRSLLSYRRTRIFNRAAVFVMKDEGLHSEIGSNAGAARTVLGASARRWRRY